ncbi:Transposon Tf2-8 polyprotein [Araneus ventricosus]|uniref:RNA-directed DNA polymerase n=1 Tax=Araneus ventricosus TaxID=182803 RepID=A0A4Y2KGP0_ARAVE|nr:Transposon Tf2-8 polyprotein [Araneus ventricosus]
MDHTVTINLNLVIILILINVKVHVAEVFGKLRPAVDSKAGSADDELKDCNKYRLFVTDKQTGLRFLVDSGADLSIIPATPNLKISLFTDASDYAVGSVLQQFEDDSWKPLSFFSKTLSNAQKGHSTYDRELLGIYLPIKQFKHILEGRQFTMYADHKPLMFAFEQKNEKGSPRQLRHLQYISEFSTDIHHIGRKENIVADSLSRIESISEIDYDKIADAQIDSKALNELRSKPSLHFKHYSSDSGNLLWCDISTTIIRPFIPQDFRMHIFQKIHSLAHPGVKSTVKQIASRFIWINIRKDITQWAKSLIHCQKNKINRHTRAQIATYIEVDDRFSVINIDIIRLFPESYF